MNLRPAVVCACLVLVGCSAPAVNAPETATSTTASPAPTTTTTATTTAYSTARFATTHRWPDGLSIKVGKPAPFLPSGWVREVNAFTQFRALTVTVANRTGATFDLRDLQIVGRSGGRAADPVHDPGKVGPAPPAKVGKGKTVTFRIALGVKKADDLQLQVTPDVDHQPVVFR